MLDISPLQIVIVLVIALLVFGPRRLPETGRELGRGLREFKDSITSEAAAARGPRDGADAATRRTGVEPEGVGATPRDGRSPG